MKSSIFIYCFAIAVQNMFGQVREVTLGVDINCRSGLSECYVMVGKGLIRLDGVVKVAERPSNALRTCVIETRDGQLLEPDAVAQQLRSLQIGARLRALEATVDGSAQLSGKDLLLQVPGVSGRTVRLQALTGKVQWDEKRDAPEIITQTEKRAYATLIERVRSSSVPVRVTGPIRESKEGLVLEVRDFELHPELKPAPVTLTAKVKARSRATRLSADSIKPLRDELQRLEWVEFVPEPDFGSELLFEIQLREGCFPNETELQEVIGRFLPDGRLAELRLRGTSAVYNSGKQLYVKANGVPRAYNELEVRPRSNSREESRVVEITKQSSPKSIGWEGKLRKNFNGHWTLAIDRIAVETAGRVLPQLSSERPSAPLLQATSRDGRTVQFEWFTVTDGKEAVIGYNLYRKEPSGGWVRLNRTLLPTTNWHTETPLQDWYAVTAVNVSQRESTYSNTISPAAPTRPEKLRINSGAEYPQLAWEANTEADFSSYNIYRSARPSGPYTQIAVGVTQLGYSDHFVSGHTFYYVVTATDSSGNQSTFSEEVHFPPQKSLARNLEN